MINYIPAALDRGMPLVRILRPPPRPVARTRMRGGCGSGFLAGEASWGGEWGEAVWENGRKCFYGSLEGNNYSRFTTTARTTRDQYLT